MAATRLAIFPLPGAILFPGLQLPLHIFEPRYRDMVKDALASDSVIALGDLEPGWETGYAGRPPLAPLLCAGLVAWHEELEDGKFNLLLHGVTRARVLTDRPLLAVNAWHMIRRRARAAGIDGHACCHTFRASAITLFRRQGGTLEMAQRFAGHREPKTTLLYDRSAFRNRGIFTDPDPARAGAVGRSHVRQRNFKLLKQDPRGHESRHAPTGVIKDED